jgi:hypothetical protein
MDINLSNEEDSLYTRLFMEEILKNIDKLNNFKTNDISQFKIGIGIKETKAIFYCHRVGEIEQYKIKITKSNNNIITEKIKAELGETCEIDVQFETKDEIPNAFEYINCHVKQLLDQNPESTFLVQEILICIDLPKLIKVKIMYNISEFTNKQ